MKKTSHLIWKLLLVATVVGGLLLIYLDALVSTTFEGRKWEIPAKVFARPLELFPGKQLRADEFAHELSILGYRKVDRVTAAGQLRRSGQTLQLHTRSFRFPDEQVPAQSVTVHFSADQIATVSSRGKALDLLRLEPVQIGGIYPRHREDRLLLQLREVPETLTSALLAVEDRRFYQHWGISPTGIGRAALANYRAGRVVQGGTSSVTWMEEWRTENDLKRHLRSPQYRKILIALDMADAEPEVRFDTVVETAGMQLIAEARGVATGN